MKVRILHSPFLEIGSIMDLDFESAYQLIRTGRAEEYVEPVAETATLAPPENAMQPKPRPRKAG